MPAPIIAAVAAPFAGAIAGKIFGPKNPKGQSGTPQDLLGLRGQNIQFLQSIMRAPDAASRNALLENFFGKLENPLQTDAGNVLKGISGDNGAATIAAMEPQFQKNLAYANQSGGRFGSANALMRASAANDFNMLSAQIGERAQDRRMGAAGLMSALGQQLTQNRVGLLNQLLSTGQSATLSQPTTMSPSGAQQGAALGGGVSDILTQMMPYLLSKNTPAGVSSGPADIPNSPINTATFSRGYRSPSELAGGY